MVDTQFSRPRQRLRSFGIGIVSGNALSQDNVMSKLEDNLSFRFSSLGSMLMGQGGTESMSPIERRQAIRSRRQDLLSEVDALPRVSDNLLGGDSSGSSSGQISNSRRKKRSMSTKSERSSTPAMSEVNRGTKARAAERGFGN